MNIEGIQTQLEMLNSYVNDYYTKNHSLESLNSLLKRINGLLFYLETVRCNTHEAFQKKIYDLVASGKSVSRAENQAHTEIPLMYKLRHVISGAERVSDGIRTNISSLKTELTQINN